jgi:hypothetical protein
MKDKPILLLNEDDLKLYGFGRLGTVGELMNYGLPVQDTIRKQGVYAVTVPEVYEVNFISRESALSNKNVINPWTIQQLRNKWISDVQIVYFGIAGDNSDRTFCDRLGDLLNHASGKITSSGPHKGGEILWQLVGWKHFILWLLPTGPPPEPKQLEVDLLITFRKIKGKYPFANRRT